MDCVHLKKRSFDHVTEVVLDQVSDVLALESSEIIVFAIKGDLPYLNGLRSRSIVECSSNVPNCCSLSSPGLSFIRDPSGPY